MGLPPGTSSKGCCTTCQTTGSERRWGTFVETFNYVLNADRSKLTCANGIHPLLGNSHVTWPAPNCETYLRVLAQLWNNWRR